MKKYLIPIAVIVISASVWGVASYLNQPQGMGGATILFPYQGGTGISDTPTKGDLLAGQSGGTYGVLSIGSDSLVLTASSGASDGFAWVAVAGTGDMTKAVYDTNSNSIVDSADDLTCTDCINATEIEDIYVLNTTDSMSILTVDTLTDGTLSINGGTIVDASSITSTSFIGALTGNASTATALAADPDDCGAGDFANAIAANGNLTCGSEADPNVDTAGEILAIIDNTALDFGTGVLTATGFVGPLTGEASTAAALTANGGNCNAGEYPLGVDASGAVESCTDATTEINAEIGNVLDGTDAFTDFNGADIIDTDNLNWANFTDLAEGGAVAWGNLGAGELADNSVIDADIDDDGIFSFSGAWTMTGILTVDTITDGTLTIDDGAITGASSITSTSFVGALTGNADTADALTGATTNCNAGEYPLGIDVNGDVESCTDATTEINTEIGNVLDGTDAFTDFNGADIIDTDNLNWGNFTDLGEGGTVTWGNVAAGELGDDSVINADIDDDGNFTFTGLWNFGGSASFEIPNNTGLTVDAAGEIMIDTTDDQLVYFGAAEQVLTANRTISMVVESPSTNDAFMILKAQDGMTITDVHCLVDPNDGPGESINIDIDECNSTGDSCATFDAEIACLSEGAEDDGTIANPSIDAGDWVQLDITGADSGTISWLTVSIYFNITRE